MSLTDIKKKIEADAREEAEKILEKARSDVRNTQSRTDEEIRNMEAGYAERFKNEQPEILRRREIVAGLDVKKIELGVQQQTIADAFKGALQILDSLPSEKYLDFVGKLLKKAVTSGKENIFVGKPEKHITSEWISEFNKQQGWSLSLKKERREISGGFILEQDDIETNCSFDMLVRWVRDEIEADVVKRLFSA
jgi:V/A-type H+-transporting ATPase subunit E